MYNLYTYNMYYYIEDICKYIYTYEIYISYSINCRYVSNMNCRIFSEVEYVFLHPWNISKKIVINRNCK